VIEDALDDGAVSMLAITASAHRISPLEIVLAVVDLHAVRFVAEPGKRRSVSPSAENPTYGPSAASALLGIIVNTSG
jgi:hypothetical protein